MINNSNELSAISNSFINEADNLSSLAFSKTIPDICQSCNVFGPLQEGVTRPSSQPVVNLDFTEIPRFIFDDSNFQPSNRHENGDDKYNSGTADGVLETTKGLLGLSNKNVTDFGGLHGKTEEEAFVEEVTNIGSKIAQTPVVSRKHVPKDTDTYANNRVEKIINEPFKAQTANNCTAFAIGFVGEHIKKNGIDHSKLSAGIAQSPKLGYKVILSFLKDGPNIKETALILRETYNVKPVTVKKLKDGSRETTDQALKRVIDNKEIVISFITIKIENVSGLPSKFGINY